MIFNHILVPYDGSNPSIKALEKAIDIAKLDPATALTVAHVINLQPIVVSDMTFVQPEAYQDQVKEQGNMIIEKVKSMTAEVPNTNVVVLAGSPSEAIVDYTSDNSCDLIIMGSRGLSSLKEFMLGSVSHNVILHSRVPVMIMK
ncbi:universal stress protein [Cohnella lupini]|uniref:Nucleotide-binding universal stress UspA family protein n=1 Tax=Cohnella lupini TaxID=1294267 RepID=A0A3D9HZY5_9BACL|nr:universal stress protein [Cohnella lupini]RED54941.1 nucleotide-binding universal stress UspA family protein [Cohnella lupini]